MIKKFLKLLLASIFAVVIYFHAQSVYAASKFTTDYNVIYTVSENGITNTKLNIALLNSSSDYYASSYTINAGFENINNIKASDPGGKINPKVEKTKDGYAITLLFNSKVVGLGSKLNFTLSFDTPDVAKKSGKIWEINIPGISNPDEFDKLSVEVKVPTSFGAPAYIKPNNGRNSLVFSKEQLGKSGISIAFGEKQAYSFHLVYHIKNDNLYPAQTEIALPPTTNYQDVFIRNINPKPENVIMDKDNNWLAQFKLAPSSSMDVVVDGKVEIMLKPKPEEITTQDLTRN